MRDNARNQSNQHDKGSNTHNDAANQIGYAKKLEVKFIKEITAFGRR